MDWVNVLANRLDAHLKTALLAYFDNEVWREIEDVSGRLGLLTMLFSTCLSLFCLLHMFGIRKSNENYWCMTDVIYFRQKEMGWTCFLWSRHYWTNLYRKLNRFIVFQWLYRPPTENNTHTRRNNERKQWFGETFKIFALTNISYSHGVPRDETFKFVDLIAGLDIDRTEKNVNQWAISP